MAKLKTKIYAPSLYEALYLTVLGAGILVLGVILSAVKDYDVRNYNFFSTTSRNFVDTKLKFLDTPHWATALTFVLWMMCGILVYIAIWFVATIVSSYRADSEPLRGFLTPKGYDRSGEVFTAVARGLIRLAALVLSITWLLVLIRTILPYLTHVFATALSPLTYRSFPTALAASLLLGASLFALVVLIRFIFLRKRLLSGNITE